MNNYFDFFDVDTQYGNVFPNEETFKKIILQKKVYPEQLDIQKQSMLQSYPEQSKPDFEILDYFINTKEANNCGLYSLEEGFLRGNMFPNLYQPYKGEKVKRIVPKSEQERMMLEIQKLNFAMKDINLYLDVHPEDKCMIQLFNQYREEVNQLSAEYQRYFGPFQLSSPELNRVPWLWSNMKWPWERGF